MHFERQMMTWVSADRMCMAYRGRLASLNTPEDWNGVMNLMDHFFLRKFSFYIGLRVASRDKPPL